MARFNTAYGLCSVIDSRSLLGLSEDEDGCAVITIGKNMVIRCRISDQKQLNSWSTRLSKLTSQVVYNSIDQNYVGIFDNVYIKQWTKDDSSIEKLKKHSTKSEIHEIILHKKTSFSKPSLFVLFKNGSCMELERVMSSKVEVTGILQSDEVIQTAKIISEEEKYLIIVVQFQNKYHLCYSVQLEGENFVIVPESLKKVKLRRQGATMLGHCIIQEDKGQSLLTYWSDGFLYSLSLPFTTEKAGVGKFVGTIDTVSKKFKVAMVPVSYNQIAFYGSDISEEGAFLGIYNVKFGLFQSQTTFKLFNKPPQIWMVENNIIILMGQRLVCVPFTLQPEALSALVCSRALHNNPSSLSQDVSAVVPSVAWEDSKKRNTDHKLNCPKRIRDLLNLCSSEGWSEYGICKFLLSNLLEKKDFSSLDWCLQTFIDIPEDFIVKLLLMVLNEEFFDTKESTPFKKRYEKSQKHFLNKILRIPADDVSLLMSLRLHFKFEDCLSLLNHLLSAKDFDRSVLTWTIILLDAFYQQFLLTKDSKVLDKIELLRKRIDDEIETVNACKELFPLLIQFRNGKVRENEPVNYSYTIEKIRL